jgi:hypothetical protein
MASHRYNRVAAEAIMTLPSPLAKFPARNIFETPRAKANPPCRPLYCESFPRGALGSLTHLLARTEEISEKTYSVRLATRAKSVGLSQPSLDPEGARLSSQVGRIAFAVPGDLATPTGGYRYDQRIIHELRRLGWRVDVLDLGDGFPFPSVAQRATALVILSAVPGGCPIVLDGLAFGALPEAGALRCRTPLIALV